MKKRFSDEQIISILREAEAGVSARELCRKHAISDATFYTWRKMGKQEQRTARPVYRVSTVPVAVRRGRPRH
jgi:putative transposase